MKTLKQGAKCLFAGGIVLGGMHLNTSATSALETDVCSIKLEQNRIPVNKSKRAIVITKEDAGKLIKVPRDYFFSVQLSGNLTTGYRWTTVDLSKHITLVSEQFSENPTTDITVGKTGIHSFQFKAVIPGIIKLQFKQWRQWEGENSVSDTFNIWLDINPL